MKRLFLIPALASLLAGCVYSDYAYRGYGGDYYYGRPSVEYRYYGGYNYGYPYGYGYPYYGGYYRYGYPYGYPYGGYYSRPYYRPYPYYPGRPHHSHPPVVVQPDPSQPGTPAPRPGKRPGPWQVLDGLDRAPGGDYVAPRRSQPVAPPRPVAPGPVYETRERSSSPIGTLTRGMREPGRRRGESAAQQEP